jgi:5-formaminoimidazole-4-carboxamide-1-beta-D-ribofuranosyl 5'-monophosphate synthetase
MSNARLKLVTAPTAYVSAEQVAEDLLVELNQCKKEDRSYFVKVSKAYLRAIAVRTDIKRVFVVRDIGKTLRKNHWDIVVTHDPNMFLAFFMDRTVPTL